MGIEQDESTECFEKKYTRFQIHEGMRKLCTDMRLNPKKYQNEIDKHIGMNIEDVIEENLQLLMNFI